MMENRSWPLVGGPGFPAQQLGAILAGKSYQAGTTAVFVMWDEDSPVANLQVAPSANPGPRPGSGSHKAALKTMMQMLGSTHRHGQSVWPPE